jgi:hypothetical protein
VKELARRKLLKEAVTLKSITFNISQVSDEKIALKFSSNEKLD